MNLWQLNIDSNQRELDTRGTPMFPCGRYFSDLGHNVTSEIPWHWHKEIEVLVISSGSIRLLINGLEYILQKGEGAFINSNALHSMQISGSNGAIFNSFVFHTDLISGTAESVFEQRFIRPLVTCDSLSAIPLSPTIPWEEEALNCITEALLAFDSTSFAYELIVREKLAHLWYLIIQNKQSIIRCRNLNESLDAIRIKDMLRYVHQHFSEPLEVEQIAAVSNLSERECLRCFHKTIGISPIQYLLKYRISTAARLLTDTNASITEICAQTGFDSPSYFSKLFKRYMNTSPTVYRKLKKTH